MTTPRFVKTKHTRECRIMSQILVIDDDKSIVDVMQLLLERDGHKVFGATDTGEAVTALEQFAVDIVITDVQHGRHALHDGASAQGTAARYQEVRSSEHEAHSPRPRRRAC